MQFAFARYYMFYNFPLSPPISPPPAVFFPPGCEARGALMLPRERVDPGGERRGAAAPHPRRGLDGEHPRLPRRSVRSPRPHTPHPLSPVHSIQSPPIYLGHPNPDIFRFCGDGVRSGWSATRVSLPRPSGSPTGSTAPPPWTSFEASGPAHT